LFVRIHYFRDMTPCLSVSVSRLLNVKPTLFRVEGSNKWTPQPTTKSSQFLLLSGIIAVCSESKQKRTAWTECKFSFLKRLVPLWRKQSNYFMHHRQLTEYQTLNKNPEYQAWSPSTPFPPPHPSTQWIKPWATQLHNFFCILSTPMHSPNQPISFSRLFPTYLQIKCVFCSSHTCYVSSQSKPA